MIASGVEADMRTAAQRHLDGFAALSDSPRTLGIRRKRDEVAVRFITHRANGIDSVVVGKGAKQEFAIWVFCVDAPRPPKEVREKLVTFCAPYEVQFRSEY